MAALFLAGVIFSWQARQGLLNPAGVPLAGDLIKHRGAGVFVREGRENDLYHGSKLAQWVHRQWYGKDAPGLKAYDYVYPPLVAGVASLGADIPYLVWAGAAQLFLVAAHAGTYLLLRRCGLGGDVRLWAWWLGIPVVYYNLIIGQNSGLSLLILTSAALLLQHGRVLTAAVVAAGVAYKPQLLPPLFLFMCCAGQWRFALALTGASLAWGLAGLTTMGWDLHLQWLDALRRMSTGEHPVMLDLNPSVPGALGAGFGRSVQGLATLVGIGVVAWASWRARQLTRPSDQLFAAMAALCVWSPYMMHYDLLLAAPWWLVQLGRSERSWKHTAAAVCFWIAALLSINPLGSTLNPATPFLLTWWLWVTWKTNPVPATGQNPRTEPSA